MSLGTTTTSPIPAFSSPAGDLYDTTDAYQDYLREAARGKHGQKRDDVDCYAPAPDEIASRAFWLRWMQEQGFSSEFIGQVMRADDTDWNRLYRWRETMPPEAIEQRCLGCRRKSCRGCRQGAC